MRVIKTQKGFTIIETLIVLAVTMVMLFATILLVSGQVNRYSFRESSINMEQRLNDVINDTRTGYFETINTNAVATDPTTGISFSCTQEITNEAGTSNCVYVGKTITINSANNTMEVSSLVAEESKIEELFIDMTGGNVGVTDPVIENLPSGMDYVNDVTFEVRFTNFSRYNTSPTKDVSGQGQAISIYSNDPLPLAIKANNGSRKVVYCVGKAGSLAIYKAFDKEDCT